MKELNDRIAAALANLSRNAAVEKLQHAGVPVSAVLGQAELPDDPHLQARGVMQRLPDGGAQMGHPLHYRTHPAQVPSAVPPLVADVSALPEWLEPGAS